MPATPWRWPSRCQPTARPSALRLCVVRDANMRQLLAGGNRSWCPEMESRATPSGTWMWMPSSYRNRLPLRSQRLFGRNGSLVERKALTLMREGDPAPKGRQNPAAVANSRGGGLQELLGVALCDRDRLCHDVTKLPGDFDPGAAAAAAVLSLVLSLVLRGGPVGLLPAGRRRLASPRTSKSAHQLIQKT